MAYSFRHHFQDQLDLLDVVDEEDAKSTVGALSSPPRMVDEDIWSEISSPVAFRDAHFEEDSESTLEKQVAINGTFGGMSGNGSAS